MGANKQRSNTIITTDPELTLGEASSSQDTIYSNRQITTPDIAVVKTINCSAEMEVSLIL